MNFDKLFTKAINCYNLKNFPEAKKILKEILKKKSDYLDALHLLGHVYLIQKNYNLALNYYNKATKINSNFSDIWVNKGVIYKNIGNYNQSLESYNKAIQIKSNYLEAWFNLGNLHLRLKDFNETIKSFKKVLELNPKNIDALLNLGFSYLKLKKYQNALDHYDKAIKINPNFAKAWSNKGIVLKELKKYQNALNHYNKAIQIDPNYAKAWSNKGVVLERLGKILDALDHYNKAIEIDPNYAKAWCNKGAALTILGNFNEAIECYDKSISLDKNLSESKFNKSIILLSKGDFDQGWKLYEERWNFENNLILKFQTIKRLENLENIANKKILIWYEQGLGDTLHFYRYLKLLIGLKAKVTFLVQNPIKDLFPKFKNMKILTDVNKMDFDFQLPLLSLPKIFKTNLKNIPPILPLKINKEIEEFYKRKLNLKKNNKMNIGIALSGNKNNVNNNLRSISLDTIEPIINIGNYFVLQNEIDEKDQIFIKKNKNIQYFGNETLENIAALIKNLDLIITVDTVFVHISGTLNKNTILLLNSSCDWRWMNSSKQTPWYPSIKIFKTVSLNNWKPVILRLKNEVKLIQKF